MAKQKKKTRRKPAQLAVPIDHWDLPASYSSDRSRMVSFREYIDPNIPTRNLTELSHNELAELVARRIELRSDYKMMLLGAGVVDRVRAIDEVRRHTHVGRILMEIEQRAIHLLSKHAANVEVPAPRARRRGATISGTGAASGRPKKPIKVIRLT